MEEAAAADRILQGDYYAELMALRDFVSGKTVVRSVAGNVGFILFLDDATWVAAYRRGERVEHAMGSHAPGIELMSAIVSQEYGDASKPLAANVIYANETCDNAEEVAKSHGSKITTLSIGERSLNFAFADDHELDVKLVDDRDGRPAFRVFWEQW